MPCASPNFLNPTDPIAEVDLFYDALGNAYSSFSTFPNLLGNRLLTPIPTGGILPSNITVRVRLEKRVNGTVRFRLEIACETNGNTLPDQAEVAINLATAPLTVSGDCAVFLSANQVTIPVAGTIALTRVDDIISNPNFNYTTWSCDTTFLDAGNVYDFSLGHQFGIDAVLHEQGGTVKGCVGVGCTSFVPSDVAQVFPSTSNAFCLYGTVTATSLTVDVGNLTDDTQIINANTVPVDVILDERNVTNCSPNRVMVKARGAFVTTVLPRVGTIDGNANYLLPSGESALFYWESTLNMWIVLANS